MWAAFVMHWVLDIGILPASDPLQVPGSVLQSTSTDSSAVQVTVIDSSDR